MRGALPGIVVLAILIIAIIAVPAGRASPAEPGQTKKPPKTVTLSGCVQRDDKGPDRFLLTDAKAHQTYRLSGVNLREYLGRPVHVDGGVVAKGLKITGGLLPNPNIAAQAGAIDPSRAAVESAGGIGPTGSVDDVQEFRVKAVRPAGGSCQ